MIFRFPRPEFVADVAVFIPEVGLLIFDQATIDEFITQRVRELVDAGTSVSKTPRREK